MSDRRTLSPFSRSIWEAKYRLTRPDGSMEAGPGDTFARVARAAAMAEAEPQRDMWEARFTQVMADGAFLPAGRILAGAGTGRQVTLFNCFVMGTIGDDMGSIFANVREAALTMQQGGGIGHDFSSLRPKGAPVKGVGADASGPVSFMDVWDAMCRTILSAGQRRGAMMGTLRCDHPDIELFIDAKRDAGRLRMFNLSVLVTGPFMAAVEADAGWDLVFAGTVFRTVRARDLWQRIMRATYDYAEPGVIFIDRINQQNNLGYCETLHTTNPCGEQPLPDYGACLLGSINLAALVEQPFAPAAELSVPRLEAATATAVRFLDDVIDVSGYPLEAQRREAYSKRRIGLGVTGLADALAMSGLDYRTPEARERAGGWMRALQNAAYRASADLAREKGAFPLYDREQFLERPGVKRLERETQAAISEHGVRNGLLTSIAPTGTISLLADNVSSGIEPIFDLAYDRRILEPDGRSRSVRVEDHAHRLFRAQHGLKARLPEAFVTAEQLTPAEHLEMQAALQPWVDSSISKTINCPEAISYEAFADIYTDAYRLGLKGCTTFRPNAITGSILSAAPTETVAEPATAGGVAHGVGASGSKPTAGVPATARAALADSHDPGAALTVPHHGITQPIPRDRVLAGYTYKLRWPDSDHAMYVTLNDVMVDGVQRPFEIFINSKNLEHYAWTVALTRMISAVFRRGGEVGFVVEELKAVFDPRGGHWLDGRYVPSLLAAIGEIIENHMLNIGFLPEAAVQESAPGLELGTLEATGAGLPERLPERLTTQSAHPRPSAVQGEVAALHQSATASATHPHVSPGNGQAAAAATGTRFCPRCNQRAFVLQEGCWTCRQCGYSRCG